MSDPAPKEKVEEPTTVGGDGSDGKLDVTGDDSNAPKPTPVTQTGEAQLKTDPVEEKAEEPIVEEAEPPQKESTPPEAPAPEQSAPDSVPKDPPAEGGEETPLEAIKVAEKIYDLSEKSEEKDPAPEVKQKTEPTPQHDPDTKTVRSEETGDKVYVVKGDKRYWIRNPETLKSLGFHLGGEKKIPFEQLLKYPEGEPVDMTVPNAVLPWDKPEEADKPEEDKEYKVYS